MTQLPAASREQVEALLGDVDESYVDRVLDIGPSVDEIGEAIDGIEGRFAGARQFPSSTRVARVRTILEELLADETPSPQTFPLRGIPLGHPV